MGEVSKALNFAHSIVRARFMNAQFQHENETGEANWADWLAQDIAETIERAARYPEDFLNDRQ